MQRLNLRSEGDKFQIIYEPIFRVDHQTLKRYFEPAKSNIKGAFMSTDKLIFKYLKTNPDVLKQAQALMNKEDKTGKLEKIYPTTEEYKKLLNSPHYFLYLNIVFNEDSLSSPTRIAVDGSRKIAGLEATVSTLIELLDNSVGNMLHAITSLRMFWYAFSADVQKFYHQTRLRFREPYAT